MRQQAKTKRLNDLPTKETKSMYSRLKRLALALAAVVAISAFALPATSASAAGKPWWQVLTGSRPTNLWKATDNVQEIETELSDPIGFGEDGLAGRIEINGKVVGCLASPNFPGTAICEAFVGLPPTSTAEQLKTVLESAFGTTVEVTGGPVGGEPFVVTVVERGAPPIIINTELEPGTEVFEGSANVKVLSPGGSGRLVLTLTNLGTAPVDGTTTPVTIVDELPEGVTVGGVEGFAGAKGIAPVDCEAEAADLVSCTFEGVLPPYEAIEIEIGASLTGDPPVAGAPGKVTVSGGGAATATGSQPIKVSPESTPFGIERFSSKSEEEGGLPTAQAGAHPFQLTNTIQLNAGEFIPGALHENNNVEQPDLPRNFRFPLPAGLVGVAAGLPECDMTTFLTVVELINLCPDEAVIGVASVTVIEELTLGFARIAVPVFNLPPATGEPARFGFMAAGAPVVINTEADPDNEYKIVGKVSNATQIAKFLSGTVSFWGVPGDPLHDSSRGWSCVYFSHPGDPCQRPANLQERAFLRQPVSCVTPNIFGVELEPWNTPLGSAVEEAEFSGPSMVGCNQVPFNPTIGASATSKLASNPSGFDFNLQMPNFGLLNPNATAAEGQAKKVEVTLPKGMTINPSQGDGLAACSPADYARETFSSPPGFGCPEASKIGEVQISTPLLEEEAHGSLYVASPYDNPFDSLLALYMVAKIPERGVLVKQAGVVRPDPVTGQLVSTFDDLPQIPVESFTLHFREGGRAPLVTPPACGTYDVVAKFTPWHAADPDNPAPDEIVTRTSSFDIERGVDGGACPGGGIPPFHPGLTAGTINNAAGSYSPFNVRLTRNDGEQEFTNFSIKLPPGVIGKLAGVDVCSDAAIAAAKARTGPNGGLEELEHPSCPANSYVGRTLVGAGVGSSLTYVPGKIYLAGPFNGAPLSVVSITAARVGPFDLGTVVLRLALKVNPETAEVFVDPTGSDPIPHIIQGIPVHARDIRAYVDRPEFVLNPTSCERTSTASTVLGSGLDFGSPSDDEPVTVTSPFQAADCASLGFKPKLSLQLLGGTKRGDTPRLKAVLTPRKGDANIGRAQVTLPHSAFLEQAHIRTVCTRVQFKAGGGNGEQCPKGSVYGKATAITPLLDEPLKGKVFLRSSDNELPDLVAALHSSKIDFNLVGRIDSLDGRIRNTFDAPPDAPVTKFILEMQGGQKGLIVNSTNICKGKHRAIAAFTGQNGRAHNFKPVVKAKCGGKKAKKGNSRAR
ncbi:MAG: hypothetical protein QOF06_288 [Solirubrobacterales bacterium]|jgi:hypothetical protein|nr:hypothetical protein [Solirubrobacterales bacterium]